MQADLSSSAEADADVIGHRNGARQGFSDPAQAQAYCDLFNWLRATPVIADCERTDRETRQAFAESASRAVFGSHELLTLPHVESHGHTVRVTPLPSAAFVATPERLSAVVNGCLVEVDFVRCTPCSYRRLSLTAYVASPSTPG